MKRIKKPVLLIDRKKFLTWFFDDYEAKCDFFKDNGVLKALVKQGKFTITAEDILEQCGYIPEHIKAKGQGKLHVDEYNEVILSEYNGIKFS
jgi:uncharacterized protein YifE (UPF0438 family)